MIAEIEKGNIDLNELSSVESPKKPQNREIDETDDLIEELDETTMIEYLEDDIEVEEFELMEVAPVLPVPILSQETSVSEPKTIEKYCRTCGKSPEGCFTKLSTRFEDDETPEMTLSALYYDVIGIDPKETLSVLICYECEAKLKSSFKFKQMALRTEKEMTDKLEEGGVVTEIEVTSSEKFFTETEEMIEENSASMDVLEESFSESNLTVPVNDEEMENLEFEDTEFLSVVSDIVAVPVDTFHSKVRSSPKKSQGKRNSTPVLMSSVGDEESERELEYCEKRFDPKALETFYQDLKCDNCGVTRIDSYNSFLNHNREYHEHAMPYKAVCQKRFATPKELEAHMEFMHEKVRCDTCDIDFVNRDQFKQHLVIHEAGTSNIGVQLNKCDNCNVSFASKQSFLLHMSEHNRTYNCHHCSLSFKEKEKLATHIKRRHKFTCETCGNSYGTLKLLQIHERSHSGVKPYKCNLCPKALVSEDGLKVHLKYVHKSFGSTDKTCNICDKIFTSKNGFIRHYRIHTGTFVKCSFSGCGRKFTTNFSLKKHVEMVHDDVRPYQCCECPKRYKSNSHLTKHVETEHLKMRFLCPICHKMISSRWDFRHHVKKYHPDELDTKPIERYE